MRLIIAGSRTIPMNDAGYQVVRQAVLNSGLWKKHKFDIEVVSGRARGVDKLGEAFANRNGLKIHYFPADWRPVSEGGYGKQAGYIRNCEMGEFAAECPKGGALIAVWDGKSRGTQHMIEYATERGLFVFVERVNITDFDV